MKLLYKKVLDLELWHDYYLGQPEFLQNLPNDYDVTSILSLVPTLNCKQILQNLHWVFRLNRWGAMIFAEVNEVEQGVFHTKIPVDRPCALTFWLVVRDPRFVNFTNLPFTSPLDRLYYFSNGSNNSQGQTLFLTQPLPSYPSYYPGYTSYHLGQLVTQAGKTWEVLHDQVVAGDAPGLENWESLPASQYVSELDQHSRQELLQQDTPLTENTRNVLLTDPLIYRGAWGLLEIVLNSHQVSSAFSLVQAENGHSLIQPKTYVIRFKNRSTHWRYCYEQPHGFTPEDLSELHFEFADDRTYFTQRPQGLLQKPPNPLLTDVKDHWLPAPQVTLIKPEIKNQKIAIYSDIYL